MGQKYRKVADRNHLEPSHPQLLILLSAKDDGRISVHCECCGKVHSSRVIRACVERGWISSPQNPEYGYAYYHSDWFITDAGKTEVEHQKKRAALSNDLGIKNRPSVSRLME